MLTVHRPDTVIIVNWQGDIIREISEIKHPQDAQVLEDGRLFASQTDGALMFSPDNKVQWRYKVPQGCQNPVAQVLSEDRFLVGHEGLCKLLEINSRGETLKEIPLNSSFKGNHGQFRFCRKTAEGTYLVPFTQENTVREYNGDGELVRDFGEFNAPVGVLRLPNGHTLIGSRAKVDELDENGNIAWTFDTAKDGGLKAAYTTGLIRLKNGNTLIAYYHAMEDVPDVIEVTADKKIVRSMILKNLNEIAMIQLLDENSKPSQEVIGSPGLAAPESLSFEEIMFIKRMPYSSDHYYTDIDNGTHPNRFVPGNGIFIYNLRTQTERPVVTAADLPGGKGFIGKISLSFDAKKVLFDFRENPSSGFRIWQVNTDGSGLKQITFPAPDEAEKAKRWKPGWHTDDIHPCYLPNGRIIFSSTRNEHTVLCGGSSGLTAPALHLMDADGSNIEQITQSPVSEFCPVVLDDGRVMYHRWEYIDKGARVSKVLMSMYPDGTKPQELYGLGDDTTTVYMYPQQMPGDTGRVVCVGTCHFPQGGCLGSIMLINLQNRVRHRGPDPDEKDYRQWDDRYAVNNITPEVFVDRRTEPGWFFKAENGSVIHDRNGASGHLFTHPWPVSDTEFLVSYKINTKDHYKNVANAYGLYLIDIDGKRQLIHKDDNLSCWHPTPLAAKKVPPVLSSPINPKLAKKKEALCVLTNIYQDMPNVEPGEIKYLRINEALPRYWSTGRQWAPSNSSSSWKAALWPRVQWGIVPVEADGSACFTVPADRAIFLQALDKDYREIQRERTYVNYRPGEIRSCVGCHGRSGQAPSAAQSHTPMALKRPPSTPQPQPCDFKENGGSGLAGQVIHYPTDIQPMFDAKCISCHGNEKPKADLNLTGSVTQFYSTSFEQIYVKRLAGPVLQEFTSISQGDRGNYNGAELPPKSLGSLKSPLIDILTNSNHPKNADEDHSKKLNTYELMILTRWVDSNYQFYGSYYGRQHPAWQKDDPKNTLYDPADFRRKATFKEAINSNAPKWHR